MKSLYIGALLFCIVLIGMFSLLRYVGKTGESIAILVAVFAAFLAEWWYRRRQS